jgi:hypothetical protein
MLITVQFKNVYGNELCYPMNEAGQILKDLLGKRTINARDVEYCQRLGMRFEEVDRFGQTIGEVSVGSLLRRVA